MILTSDDTPLQFPDARSGTEPALNLRPLSLGEVLDRAFHLYFKNIAAFTALVAIVIIPYAIFSYLQTRQMFDMYISLIQNAIRSPNTAPDISQLNNFVPNDSMLALQYLILFLGFPFALGAVVVGVSKAYLGQPVLFGESYRYALHRWLPLLLLVFVWGFALLFGSGFVFLGILVVAFAFGAIGSLIGASVLVGIGIAVFLIAFFIAAIVVYLTAAMSFIAVVIERVDPLTAFGQAFRRMFSTDQFWRGFALALALSGIEIAASLVCMGLGVLAVIFVKSVAIYFIALGLTSLFFTPFAVVAAAVFYYDVRIRREGYDLQMLADRFAAAASGSATSA